MALFQKMSSCAVMPYSLFTLLAIVLGMGVPTLALANEIWLEPSNRGAQKAIGNWGVANLGGETHVAFHVPDDYDTANEDSHAFIVLLPEKDTTFDYIVRINVAREGQSHTMMPADTGVLNVSVTGGQVKELDISSLLPTLLPSDYVTVNLELPNNKDSTQVVGMRFQYVGIDESVAGQSCPAGQVVTGYAADGTIQCKVDLDTRAVGACQAGQHIREIKADGTVSCEADMHVKGTSCPAGEFLTGYDANGVEQCAAIAGGPNDHNPCENGGTPVGTRWIVSNSGRTVCDKNTNTTWEQHPTSIQRNQADSIAYCQSLGLGGGWELPSLQILQNLKDNNSPTCTTTVGSICLPVDHPFTNVQSAFYASADTISLFLGHVDNASGSPDNHAWCAR